MKRLWYQILHYVDCHFRKAKWCVIWEAISGYPYDSGFLLKLERAKLKEMLEYFKRSDIVDHTNDIKWIKICINLLDIIIEEPEDYPYVNIQNMWRFIRPTDYAKGVEKENVEHYYKSYPQDLRWVKAEHLYYEIRKRYTTHWWD